MVQGLELFGTTTVLLLLVIAGVTEALGAENYFGELISGNVYMYIHIGYHGGPTMLLQKVLEMK